jgi:hypothetical protein
MKALFERYGVLATAAALLIGSGFEVAKDDTSYILFAVCLTAGLIVLGSWLTIEIQQQRPDDRKERFNGKSGSRKERDDSL